MPGGGVRESSSPPASTPAVEPSPGLFVFASGPDCFSVEIATGQPYVLQFPQGWRVDRRGPEECDGPRTGSSIVAVRDAAGTVVARSGDVVRVDGDVTATTEEAGPVMAVSELQRADVPLTEAMEAWYRDPDFPYSEMRTREAFRACGLIVSDQFATEQPPPIDEASPVWECLWNHHESRVGVEYVSLRDTLDAGIATRVVRIHADGLVDVWTLLRSVDNRPMSTVAERCEGLEASAPSGDRGEPQFVGCELLTADGQ